MMEVVYACNESYLEQTIISINSLLRYNSHLKVYLIEDAISEERQDYLKRYVSDYVDNINIISIDKVLGDIELSEEERHPKTIYVKLFLDRVLKCDKVLYIDSDIVVNGSLRELENRSMNDELAAGVIMPYSVDIKEKQGIASDDVYICDGMVLINLDNWRKQGISDKCKKYIEVCNGKPYMLSEGVLNYICRGKIGVLEPAYNLMPSMIFFKREEIIKLFQLDWYYSEEQIEEAKSIPKMIHFMRELYNRPWFEPSDHPYVTVYRKLDENIFECEKKYEKIKLPFRTRVNKWMYRILPFRLYLSIYTILKTRRYNKKME